MNGKAKLRKWSLCVLFALAFAVIIPNVTSQNIGMVEAKAESAKSSTKKLMKAIQKSDNKTLNKYVKAQNYKDTYKQLKVMSPAMYSYVKKNNAKMTYTIKSCKTKGKVATVKIRVKCVDSSAYTKAVQDAYSAQEDEILAQIDQAKVESMSFDQALTYMVEKLFSAIDQICKKENAVKRKTVYRKRTITLTLTKSGSRWVVKEIPDNSPFAEVMLANLGSIL